MNINLRKIIQYLLLLFLFLLPWQTRWIYAPAYLNGGFWEYGAQSFYATEILLWLIIILFAVDRFRSKELLKKIFSREHFRKNKNKLFYCSIVLLLIGAQVIFSINREISFNWVFHLIEAACLGVVLVSVGGWLSLSCQERVPRHNVGAGESVGVEPVVNFGNSSVPSANSEHLPLVRGGQLLLLAAIWLGGVVQGALAVWQFFTQEVFANKWLGLALQTGKQPGASVIEFGDERWLRAYGSFGSPNILGGYLAVCLVVGLILYLSVGRGVLIYAPVKRDGESANAKGVCQYAPTVITVGQILILSGLILSFSRGAWLAAVVGIAVLGWGVWRWSGVETHCNASLQRLARHLLSYLLTIIFFLAIFWPIFSARFNLNNRLELRSAAERVSQYQEFSKIFFRHPLLGIGPGTYTLALYQTNPHLPVWQYQPAHNVYLLALAEIGAIGCFIVFLFSCFLIKLVLKRERLFLSVFVMLFILGLVDHWLWSMYFGQMVLGVVFCLGISKMFHVID